jgi:hypothetical protein
VYLFGMSVICVLCIVLCLGIATGFWNLRRRPCE